MKRLFYVMMIALLAVLLIFWGSKARDTKGTNPKTTDTKVNDIKASDSKVSDALGVKYKNGKFGFTLDFPDSWKGKYYVEERDHNVNFKDKASWENSGRGVLFTIWIFDSKENWNSEGKELQEMIGLRKLYENDQVVYGYSIPTDGQNVFGDVQVQQEYESMQNDVAAIIKTFKKE